MWKYGDGKTPTDLKIGCWDVAGIRSIIQKGFLQDYLNQSKPDLLCICNTKIDLKYY